MEIILARAEHLAEVAVLFDQYRVFYNQAANLDEARHFIQERIQAKDSKIFIARKNGSGVGFTQLYPSFSSVSMKRVWILNDLFVQKSHRHQGVAKLLMATAEDYARETGAVRIILATQISNIAAQALYKSQRYRKDQDFHHYALQL
jgi:GNAT superfamily N-acetyltransferase